MTFADGILVVEAVKAFQDNYIWLLSRPGSAQACVVDPGDAAPVRQILAERELSLTTILLTHHHADHVGGVAQLVSEFKPTVYGPNNPGIVGIQHHMHEGDSIQVMGCQWQVMEVPGHTLDHIAYFAPQQKDAGVDLPLLFCGDTMFAAGCGRLFEGTAAQMYASLQKFAQLPADSLVYCAHEYTLANIRFARVAEQENQDLIERQKVEVTKLEQTGITLPSTIGLELRTNPFLRCHSQVLQKNLSSRLSGSSLPAIETFAALRSWKDEFRG